MQKKELKAEVRKLEGRKVKNLRKEGILPGNVFGKNIKSESVQVVLKDFEKIFKEAGETGLVTLSVEGVEKPVLIHNLQLDPVLGTPIHVDFFQVNLKEKVTAEVPVELVGQSPTEKQALGTVVQQMQEIEVEALPGDLPEKFEVGVEGLTEVDQAIYVKDLKYDRTKVEVKADAEAIVAKVEPPQKEEVVAAPVTPAEGVPAEGAVEGQPEVTTPEETSSTQNKE